MANGNGMAQQIATLIRAKYTLLAVQSKEELRVERLLKQVAAEVKAPGTNEPFQIRFWSLTQGITDFDGEVIDPSREPVEALQFIQKTTDRAIYVMRDLHPFLTDAQPQRALRDTSRILKKTKPNEARVVILLSPVLTVPPELEADLHVVDWPLPKREDLERVLADTIKGLPEELRAEVSKTVDKDRVVTAALGLTAEEAYSAFARSVVEKRTLDPVLIMNEKKQMIAQSGILEWLDAIPEGLAAVGDLDELKEWLAERYEGYSPEARQYGSGIDLPKGVFLGGVPGSGKTLIAKALGGEWGCPVIRFNVAALFTSSLGGTEQNQRRAFRIIEVIGFCVLLIDEVDKSVGGGGGGERDGDTSSRARGEFLTWLQERTNPAFVLMTANNVEMLAERSPELFRPGRIDEFFALDLPSPDGRKAIFHVHTAIKRRIPGAEALDLDRLAQATDGYSGSEIEAVITDAVFRAFRDGRRPTTTDDVLGAVSRRIPMSKKAGDRIASIQRWGKLYARPASKAEVRKDEERSIEVA